MLRLVRLWDFSAGVRLGDLPTQSDSCVTALDMDKGVLAASFGHGQIKLFDYRAPPLLPGSWPSGSTNRWCCPSRCRRMAYLYQDALMGWSR